MKITKQSIIAFILGAIIFSGIGAFAETQLNIYPNPYPVIIDGKDSVVDAYNINGYTYLKLADLRQTGLKVVFNETNSKIEITTQPQTIILPTPTPTPIITLPNGTTTGITTEPTVTPQAEPTPTPYIGNPDRDKWIGQPDNGTGITYPTH